MNLAESRSRWAATFPIHFWFRPGVKKCCLLRFQESVMLIGSGWADGYSCFLCLLTDQWLIDVKPGLTSSAWLRRFWILIGGDYILITFSYFRFFRFVYSGAQLNIIRVYDSLFIWAWRWWFQTFWDVDPTIQYHAIRSLPLRAKTILNAINLTHWKNGDLSWGDILRETCERWGWHGMTYDFHMIFIWFSVLLTSGPFRRLLRRISWIHVSVPGPKNAQNYW